MNCVVIEKPGQMLYTRQQSGPLSSGFARVKVMAAAICATDLEVIDGRIPAKYPLVPGHEWAGIVTEVADEKYAHWIGKRVTGSKRLAVAKQMGAFATVATKEEDLFAAMNAYHPEGTDYIIEATGIEECIANSFKLCKKGGSIALAGYGRGKVMSIRIDDIHINNLTVVGAGNNWNQHKKAVQMMGEGAVDMTPMISETLPLSQFQKGIDDARSRPEGFVKAVFTFE